MTKPLTVEGRDPGAPITLWGGYTPRALRAHWVLCELGLAYTARPIGPRTGETQTPEFTALNPRQKIPLLEIGDLKIAESAAIVSTLLRRYGSDTTMLPTTSPALDLYDQWAFFIMMELDAHTLYVIRKHRDLAPLYGEAPKAIDTAREGFIKQIAVCGQEIEERGPYLLGDDFTGVDILLATMLDWARAYEVPFPSVLDPYHQTVRARPAYTKATEINRTGM